MSEIKPCPFCGGEDIIVRPAPKPFLGDYKRTYKFAQCRYCLARTGEYGTEPKAIEAWNRRVQDETN